jgi:DNA-binding MarR family transcriptional regulator
VTTEAEPAPELTLLRSLTHLMARWSSSGTQASVAQSAGVALDAADIPPLYMLGLTGSARAGDLASALHVIRPTMSKQITRLERAGLIVRTPDPADGRVTIIALSAQGQDAHERLVAQGHRMVHEAVKDWPAEERTVFADQLSRFTASLGVQVSAGEPAADTGRS